MFNDYIFVNRWLIGGSCQRVVIESVEKERGGRIIEGWNLRTDLKCMKHKMGNKMIVLEMKMVEKEMKLFGGGGGGRNAREGRVRWREIGVWVSRFKEREVTERAASLALLQCPHHSPPTTHHSSLTTHHSPPYIPPYIYIYLPFSLSLLSISHFTLFTLFTITV